MLGGFPDTIAFASRASLFGRLGGGRSIDVNIQSRDIDSLLGAAVVGMGAIAQALPGARTRPVPGVELAEPELAAGAGGAPASPRSAGTGRPWRAWCARSATGLYVGDYFDGEQRLDMILRAAAWESPEELASLPIATPDGATRPLGEFISMERTAGPDQIRRVDRRRTITLVVTPPPDMALGTAIDTIREQVDPSSATSCPRTATSATAARPTTRTARSPTWRAAWRSPW
jgi:hypothetical protein